MQAIQGVYIKGRVKLNEKPPIDNAKVIVIFTDEAVVEHEEVMSTNEALRILDKYSGWIKRDINYQMERDEYLSERYGSAN